MMHAILLLLAAQDDPTVLVTRSASIAVEIAERSGISRKALWVSTDQAFFRVRSQEGLVAEGAKIEKAATGYKFTEGPAADADGNVWFTDIPNDRIIKFDAESGKAEVAREKTGRANGLMFDPEGRLLMCEGGNRRLTRNDGYGVTVLADAYDGKNLNSPNDLCIDARGGVYFTDPRYGKRDDLEQDKEAVYYIPPGGGKIVRVADDLVRPNGIICTSDRLYIADHGDQKVWAYGMNADGSLKDKKLFCEVASDGFTLDEKGNLYTTTGKGVEIFSPEGKPVGAIQVPEQPANCTFGGKDRKTLYITARTSLYRIRMVVRGR